MNAGAVGARSSFHFPLPRVKRRHWNPVTTTEHRHGQLAASLPADDFTPLLQCRQTVFDHARQVCRTPMRRERWGLCNGNLKRDELDSTVGLEATTLEASAAMRSNVRNHSNATTTGNGAITRWWFRWPTPKNHSTCSTAPATAPAMKRRRRTWTRASRCADGLASSRSCCAATPTSPRPGPGRIPLEWNGHVPGRHWTAGTPMR